MSMRFPLSSHRRCAAAPWAKPGAATVNDALRWAQVSVHPKMTNANNVGRTHMD